MHGHFKIVPLLLLGITLSGCASVCEKNKGPKSRIVMKHDGYEMHVMDNSESVSLAFAINSKGHVLGKKEIVDESGNIFSNIFFFDDGQKQIDLGLLKHYTNSEVEALSDNGLAVGYASRPVGDPRGSLTALLWDVNKNEISQLPHIEGDSASHAQGISADGSRIVGYSTGNEPQRLRPCVWEKKSGKWVAQALPTKFEYNPYTMSSSVVISPDGKLIASCVTESIENNFLDSCLVVWKQDTNGKWQSKQLNTEQMYVSAMNNAGEIVGDASNKKGQRTPYFVSPDGEYDMIELLSGTVSGNAYGINNEGMVVGICNDPPGPDAAVRPFVYYKGEQTALKLPKGNEYSLVYAINDAGQIAGLAEVKFEDRKEKNEETGEEEPVVKALAFVWRPTS
ncbi:MAG: hypothetical protein VXZ82_20400 [Planctomycetota bacterium]|nr:hypothetical protein [Planctomycetota bacterium]